MKLRNMALSVAFGAAAACTLRAQQSMQDMPGMKMDAPKAKPRTPAAAPTPHASQQAEDAAGRDPGGAKARAAAVSVAETVRQQSGMPHTKPGPESDAGSLKVPIPELQEPEAVGFRTGADLPAPDLLRDIVDQRPMPIASFLEMADRSNPTLAQAERNVDRSTQQARQAGLPPNPTVGYSGDHIRGGEYGGGEQGAFLSQEFVLGHKLALRRDIFRAEGRSNQFAVEMQRARIRNDVGRDFVDALAAQQSVVVYDRLLKVALDARINAHELERVGQADASDVLNAEIAAEQAKVEFVSAQRMFVAAFRRLASSAGQTTLPPCPLAGELAEPPRIDAEGMAITDTLESPAARQAQANIALAEARVRSAEREKIPNLNVKAGEWYSGEHLSGTRIAAGPESFVEAGMRVPLWNRNQGNIAAAKVELERARLEVIRVQLNTRNRAEPLAQQYETARYTADKYRVEMLPRARRAYELEVTKYQQMAQSYPHVLSAQHMLFTLQLAYIQALREEWQAATALQNFALMDGLDHPASVGEDSTTMNLPTVEGSGGS